MLGSVVTAVEKVIENIGLLFITDNCFSIVESSDVPVGGGGAGASSSL